MLQWHVPHQILWWLIVAIVESVPLLLTLKFTTKPKIRWRTPPQNVPSLVWLEDVDVLQSVCKNVLDCRKVVSSVGSTIFCARSRVASLHVCGVNWHRGEMKRVLGENWMIVPGVMNYDVGEDFSCVRAPIEDERALSAILNAIMIKKFVMTPMKNFGKVNKYDYGINLLQGILLHRLLLGNLNHDCCEVSRLERPVAWTLCGTRDCRDWNHTTWHYIL